MKTISINRGAEVAVKIELHDPELNITVHDAVVVEPKPHQFEAGKEYYVECTPEQRSEIISYATLADIKMSDPVTSNDYGDHCLYWTRFGVIWVSYQNPLTHPHSNWIPFDEFMARLKGEWEEPKPEPEHPLIGKWVEMTHGPNAGRWVEIIRPKENGLFTVVWQSFMNETEWYRKDEKGLSIGAILLNLTDPREHNPDEPREVRIQFDASRISEALRFETRIGDIVNGVTTHVVDMMYFVTGFPQGHYRAVTWNKNGQHDIDEESPLDLFMWVKEVAK